MADRYVIEFDSRQATLKGMDGRFVRRFSARGGASIVQATVSGEGDDAMVTVFCLLVCKAGRMVAF